MMPCLYHRHTVGLSDHQTGPCEAHHDSQADSALSARSMEQKARKPYPVPNYRLRRG